VMLEHLAAAGITGGAAREALRVLIVYTIGFAAFDGAADERPLPGSELRGNFDRGLRWLIAGITAGPSESLR
jgi:TetR/AcrR family transcriptional regulator, tetracycline repressor protein